jgi:hypothetical protein
MRESAESSRGKAVRPPASALHWRQITRRRRRCRQAGNVSINVYPSITDLFNADTTGLFFLHHHSKTRPSKYNTINNNGWIIRDANNFTHGYPKDSLPPAGAAAAARGEANNPPTGTVGHLAPNADLRR